jgi:phosphatidylserine/phosphatidylglycerophosphate/cardiolipin synthase-like enzyme
VPLVVVVPYVSVAVRTLAELVSGGVHVRLFHAKEPRPRFRKDFDKSPVLIESPHFERSLCPQIHMKVFLVDGKRAYVGSANLTGAGAGAKHPDRRNFEAGMLSDDPGAISQLMTALDRLYLGRTAGAVGFGSILEPGEPGRGP